MSQPITLSSASLRCEIKPERDVQIMAPGPSMSAPHDLD